MLSGLDLPAGQKIKVTVRNVTDIGGSEISPAADSVSTDAPIEKPSSDSTSEKNQDAVSSSKTSKSAPASGVKIDSPGAAPAAVYPNPALDALVSGTGSGNGEAKSTTSSTGSGAGDTKGKRASSRTTVGGKSGDRTAPRVTQCTATASSVRVTFSKEMDPKDAEVVAHYIIENPPGHTQPARAATYSAGSKTVLLSGLKLSLDSMVKVTARDVLDSHGNAIGTRGNSASYADVTTWKYMLGLGIPTLVFAIVAMFGFSRRDL